MVLEAEEWEECVFVRLWPISCGRILVVAVISQSDGCIEVQFLRAQSARSSTLILVEPKAGLGQSPTQFHSLPPDLAQN